MLTIGSSCSHDARRLCRAAYEAAASGQLVADRERAGWTDPGLPTRRVDWRRVYQGLMTDATHGLAWLLEHCPYCGGDLPDPDFGGQAHGQADGDD